MKKNLDKNLSKLSVIMFLLLSMVVAEFYLPSAISAQSDSLGLSVSPQVFEIEAYPGENIKKEIFLKNLSGVSMPMLVKVVDFTAIEDSGEMEFDESLEDPIIASRKWFKIEKPNFILEDSKQVDFEISIPNDAEPGGHYSTILFEPRLPSFYFEPGQPKTVPVIGVLFLISVKTMSLDPVPLGNPIEIVEFRIPEKEKMRGLERLLASISQVSAAEINIIDKNPSSFLLRIKNNDIYHQKVSGKILIYDFFGNKAGETEIKKTTILPNKTRQFPVEISKEIPVFLRWLPASISGFLAQNTLLGKYRVVLELEGVKNGTEISQALYFWAFPWKMLIIGFSCLIFVAIIRKRLVAAVRILLKPR